MISIKNQLIFAIVISRGLYIAASLSAGGSIRWALFRLIGMLITILIIWREAIGNLWKVIETSWGAKYSPLKQSVLFECIYSFGGMVGASISVYLIDVNPNVIFLSTIHIGALLEMVIKYTILGATFYFLFNRCNKLTAFLIFTSCWIGLNVLHREVTLLGRRLRPYPSNEVYTAVKEVLDKANIPLKKCYEGGDPDEFFYERGLFVERVLFPRQAIYWDLAKKKLVSLKKEMLVAVAEHAIAHKVEKLWLWMYVPSILEPIIQATSAVIVLNNPTIYRAFGFEMQPIIGALAIGDFITSTIRLMISNPFYLYLQRLRVYKADKYVAEKGMKSHLAENLAWRFPMKYGKFFEIMEAYYPGPEERIKNLQ